MRWLRTRTTFVTAAFIALAIAFTATLILSRDSGGAEGIPGSVAQASQARASGVLVHATRAVFSGTATEIWLEVAPEDPALRLFGIRPEAAFFDGASATSMLVGASGVAVLRFPPIGTPSANDLTIESIDFITPGGAGERSTAAGPWRLLLDVPTGDELEKALAVEALSPVPVVLGGLATVIEARRTATETLVRYEFPSALEHGPPRLVGENEAIVPLTRMERRGTTVECWYGPTPHGTNVTVLFESGPAASGESRFTVEIVPVGAVGEAPGIEPERRSLDWTVKDAVDSVPVSIEWVRQITGAVLLVLVDGIHDDSGGKPTAIGDGKALFVSGLGHYPATETRGAQTLLQADLGLDGVPPRSLPVTFPGSAADAAGPVSVVLRP